MLIILVLYVFKKYWIENKILWLYFQNVDILPASCTLDNTLLLGIISGFPFFVSHPRLLCDFILCTIHSFPICEEPYIIIIITTIIIKAIF